VFGLFLLWLLLFLLFLGYHRIPINAAASAEVSVERHFSSSKRRNGRNFGLLITSAAAAT